MEVNKQDGWAKLWIPDRRWIRSITSERYPGVELGKYFKFLESNGLKQYYSYHYLWSGGNLSDDEANEVDGKFMTIQTMPPNSGYTVPEEYFNEHGIEEHHILLRSEFPEHEYRVENIVPLLRGYHLKVHWILHRCDSNNKIWKGAFEKIKYRMEHEFRILIDPATGRVSHAAPAAKPATAGGDRNYRG